MLEDLQVLNGSLSLEFEPLNTKYSVILNNMEDTKLELKYKLVDGANISIIGNNLNSANNEVILKIMKDDEEQDYYLYVYKEQSLPVISQLEQTQQEYSIPANVTKYAAPGIAVICFLLILILFTILFHKRVK